MFGMRCAGCFRCRRGKRRIWLCFAMFYCRKYRWILTLTLKCFQRNSIRFYLPLGTPCIKPVVHKVFDMNILTMLIKKYSNCFVRQPVLIYRPPAPHELRHNSFLSPQNKNNNHKTVENVRISLAENTVPQS